MNLDNINLLNDCMFKALMTNPNNRELVVDVLHAITKIPKEVLNNANYIGGEELTKKISAYLSELYSILNNESMMFSTNLCSRYDLYNLIKE